MNISFSLIQVPAMEIRILNWILELISLHYICRKLQFINNYTNNNNNINEQNKSIKRFRRFKCLATTDTLKENLHFFSSATRGANLSTYAPEQQV